MEGLALAVILGPLLLRSPTPLTPAHQFADNAACVKLAYKLLEHHTAIFEGIGLNSLNVQEIDDSLKEKTYTEGMRTPSNRRSFKFIRNTEVRPSLKSATFSASVTARGGSVRTFYEKAIEDMSAIYEAAKQNRKNILSDARENAIKEWKSLKEKADEQDKIYKIVYRKYAAKKEVADSCAQLKEEAISEMHRLKSFYQAGDSWEKGDTLQADEIAHLQEVRALIDLRETETQLALYDLEIILQEKLLVETPHEIAQAALWQVAQELRRLDISEEDAEKWGSM